MKNKTISFSPPDITEAEIKEVAEALRSGWITTGPRTKKLEQKIAEYCTTKKSVCLNSATAALELNLRVLGIGAGDEVITSAYTYTASASVIAHVGAKIVLVDTAPDSYEMDYEKLAETITEKTKAIIPIDLGGIPCDYAKIFEIVDKKKTLFRGMKDMLEYIDEKTSDKQFYFGTDDFDHVWEKLIDRAFGEWDKEKHFPRSRWLLDYGKYKEKHPLMPDTIMIYNGKYYILDAKCYKYGRTGIPDHLPNGSSINKQITYGEYLEKYKGVDTGSLFNAFIMPYNMADNPFKLTSFVGNIGEAIGDWRYNRKYYERIQGVVMDTRYLMYHYSGKPIKEKVALAKCIETVLERVAITTTGEEPATYLPEPVTYTRPEPKLSRVAETSIPYGTENE